MSRTFRNVDPFYTAKEIKSDPERYNNKYTANKKKHRMTVQAYDGKSRNWGDFPVFWKIVSRRQARRQQKRMLHKEVIQHYIDIDQDEKDKLYESYVSDCTDYYDNIWNEFKFHFDGPYPVDNKGCLVVEIVKWFKHNQNT